MIRSPSRDATDAAKRWTGTLITCLRLQLVHAYAEGQCDDNAFHNDVQVST